MLGGCLPVPTWQPTQKVMTDPMLDAEFYDVISGDIISAVITGFPAWCRQTCQQ